MLMTQKLMTEKEKERAKRNGVIRTEYSTLRRQNPDASHWRVCSVLAGKYKLTPMAIRNIVKS